MGHVEVDAYIRGVKEEVELKRVVVDTGVTYTFLPIELVGKIGAVETPTPLMWSLEMGGKLKPAFMLHL